MGYGNLLKGIIEHVYYHLMSTFDIYIYIYMYIYIYIAFVIFSDDRNKIQMTQHDVAEIHKDIQLKGNVTCFLELVYCNLIIFKIHIFHNHKLRFV